MIYVGKFSEQDVVEKKDKRAVGLAKFQNPGHMYVKCDMKKKRGKMYLEIWIATKDEYLSGNWI
ncbi:MAG: hypothetical protein MJZ30_11500 [Paludibacteraceae bacterium]|nr:hypothetical protein [Paludibacteraceae bacterium]